jgi:AraC-like DNA-binding protein
MINKNQPSFFGKEANEDWTLFIYNRKSPFPVIIENIGITYPNPKYSMSRTNNEMYIFEYVISGSGYIEINSETIKVSANDVYIIEPGQAHKYYSDPKNPFKKIWINFYSDLFKEIFNSLGLSGKTVFKNSDTLELFEQIQNLKKLSNFSDDICYDVAPILFKILCNLATNSNKLVTISNTAKLTKKYIDDNIYQNITIEYIADNLKLSKAHVIREFSKSYGISPYNYLIEQKIAIAKKMLILHNMNINEISNKLGFEDSNYFSKLFKKKTGLSPLQYRKSKI